jgi:hypothetical protein
MIDVGNFSRCTQKLKIFWMQKQALANQMRDVHKSRKFFACKNRPWPIKCARGSVDSYRLVDCLIILILESSMTELTSIPQELMRPDVDAEDILLFLHQLPPNSGFRLKVKSNNLDDPWRTATARKSDVQYDLVFDDDESLTPIEYHNEDEKVSLMMKDNWILGWFAFLDENVAATSPTAPSGRDASAPFQLCAPGGFSFEGNAVDMLVNDGKGKVSYRLFEYVMLGEAQHFWPKASVEVQGQRAIFCYAAVPLIDGNLHPNTSEHQILLFNPSDVSIQFAPLSSVQKADKSVDPAVVDQAERVLLQYFENEDRIRIDFRPYTRVQTQTVELGSPNLREKRTAKTASTIKAVPQTKGANVARNKQNRAKGNTVSKVKR